MPKITENVRNIKKLPDKDQAESLAKCVTKDVDYFAEVRSMQFAVFCKHSSYNVFNLHNYFEGVFAMAFIDTANTHSRTVKIKMYILLMLNLKLWICRNISLQ